MNKLAIAMLSLIALLGSASLVSATTVNKCQELYPGNHTLGSDIQGIDKTLGVCLNLNPGKKGDKLALDCNGHSVAPGDAKGGVAIRISKGSSGGQVEIRNCTINGNPGSKNNFTTGIGGGDCADPVVLDNVVVDGMKQFGVKAVSLTKLTNSKITNNGRDGNASGVSMGGFCQKKQDFTDGLTIKNNTMTNNASHGLSISSYPNGGVVAGNTFTNNGQCGIYARDGSNARNNPDAFSNIVIKNNKLKSNDGKKTFDMDTYEQVMKTMCYSPASIGPPTFQVKNNDVPDPEPVKNNGGEN